ncbi:thrombospondin-2-like [Mercenaria mercenaria]|uniref:thrombospondin-2-like n=1 Tax=Mercenaria mercenaria TaxID=6596 RepID=UPI00234E8CFA|nr:thrombospondin-2-like [Mercenaria mercenaria]
MDCAKLNSLFSVCSDVNHARNVCPRFCGLCIVDGNWTAWSSWSKCDVTCENGQQSRTRSCTNPAPKNGGLDCVGDSTDVKVCKKELCPVHGGWSGWSQWGVCSVTCDMGLQRRSRNCSNPVPSLAGNYCFGDSLDNKLCMPAPCANGGWSNWSSWGICSATCGGGIRSQSRSCSNPHPSPYGKYCLGSNDRVESCGNMNCETKHCLSNPCVYGQCYEALQDYLCSCNHGYEGRYCNISTSRCQTDPCVHGTCVDMLNDYSCICHHGYEGRHCNFSNFYCRTHPCMHGTCISENSDYTCYCSAGYVGKNCDITNASDCYDILHRNISSKSGVYNIILWRTKQMKEVFCDMETDLGGWTVFQNRFDGSVNFTRKFLEYINGFGSITGEFWLGLKYIEEMSAQGSTELRIDLTAADNSHVYEVYPNFHLGTNPGYNLHVNKGAGTAGDRSGLSYHNGRPFLTYDHDTVHICALGSGGGWWYGYCADVNLNGKYFTPGTDHGIEGMFYRNFKNTESLKTSKIMFRRV